MRLAPLDVKVLRDCRRMAGQLLAIAMVMGCGLGVFFGMRATMESLEAARAQYYARQRFADVFARLQRAPEHVAERLQRLPGVERVQTRVVTDVTIDVPGMTDVATGRLVSLPDQGRPLVNDLVLRAGRWPEAGHGVEVVISEAFADAHGMRPGAELGAIINGNRERLRVVGVALSPEFIYAVGPGQIFPDDRRFGVLWMRREALGPAFDMEGAFNDVSFDLARTAQVEEVIARVDQILASYGGLGAMARKDQQSAFFLANELEQLRTFAYFTPALFLAVAAFLLNVVIGRVVASQREQIAALKALGYRDRELALHYAKLVGAVVAVALFLGCLLGAWLGSSMTTMYAAYYRFPDLPFRLRLDSVIVGSAVAVVAAALGTWRAIARTVGLPPAEAMRPAAPPVYRVTWTERLGLVRVLPPAARMVLREAERRPGRALAAVAGIAMATALAITNAFTFDSIRYLLNVQFGLSQRDDVQVTLDQPRSAHGALVELQHLPGVQHAEPYRAVPARLRAGPRSRTVSVMGRPANATLHAILDEGLRAVPLPPAGLVLSGKLAAMLAVGAGDRVRVEILEGHRAVRDVEVAMITESYVGLTAHMEHAALCRLLRETASANGAWLTVDEGALPQLHAAVKQTPRIAGVVSRRNLLGSVTKLLDDSLGAWLAISTSFALVMAFGVLYNATRITLAERARELASLRVLGFRRREVAAILLGEIGLVTAVAVPLGMGLGRLMAAALAASPGFNNEQFRLPLVVAPATYALAGVTVGVAAAVSGWSAWRRLDRIDIVEVLKSRD
ncbi:MAG: ABC transporter permease [Planctomycetota bacterium]